MNSTLSAHFLPALTKPEDLAAGIVVMIDVLRASTTITAALASGAREVIPYAEIDQARHKAAELKPRSNLPPLLGGERGGLPIEGFDLGNSPSEYTPAVVRGRTVVFTTTNGTQALMICGTAERVLIGSFVNFSAVLRELTGELPIHLLCAGTRGRITREDVLLAGAIVEKLTGPIVDLEGLNDEARIAQDVWCNAMGAVRPPDDGANQRIAEVLRNCQGGRNLASVGLQADIADAATVDRYDFVPVFDAAKWRIVKSTA
jgi:2-phosphosulfolactate phosphatase